MDASRKFQKLGIRAIGNVDPLRVVEGQQQLGILGSTPKPAQQWFLPSEHQVAQTTEMQYNQLSVNQSCSDADLQKRRRFLDNCELFAQHFQGQSSNHYSTLSPQLSQRSNVSGVEEQRQFHGMRNCFSPNQNVILEPKQNSSASFLTPLQQSQPQFTKLQSLSSCSLQGTQQRVMPSGVGPLNQVFEKGQMNATDFIQKVYLKAEILRIKHLPKLEEMVKSFEPILFELARAGQPTELMNNVTILMQMTEVAQSMLTVPNNITSRYVRTLASLDKILETIYFRHRHILSSLPRVQFPYNVQSVQKLLQSQSQPSNMQQMQAKRQVLLHGQPSDTLDKAHCEMTAGNDMIMTSRICTENLQDQSNLTKDVRREMNAEVNHSQHLKFVASSSHASCKEYPSASSQMPDRHSSLINEINAPPRPGISFCSANLPISPSPLMDSSPLPRDPGKLAQNAGYLECKQITNSLKTSSPCATGSPAISPSTVLGDCNDVENCKNSSTMASKDSRNSEHPIQRLVRLVRSMSDKALSASVNDIKAVTRTVDRMSYSEPIAESNSKVGQDLAATASFCPYGSSSNKRKINALSSTDTDKSELESSNGLKRRRTEASSHTMKEEIREINQRLVDTVVDITDEDTCGTIVRCSFSVLGTNPALKSKEASAVMFPIKPLRLLVPKNYPDCSPILLDSDKTPVNNNKKDEDLSVRVQEKLNRFLRTFCEPVSLGEIAKAWGSCAREAVNEYAARHGGGSFTSKYGAWVNCRRAS